MNKPVLSKALLILLCWSFLHVTIGCSGNSTTGNTDTTTTTISSANSTDVASTDNWDDGQIVYSARDISHFGSATPSGLANYDQETDTAVIWNIDASLDNYGGVQTPVLDLDFSKAVYFQMEVVSSFTQYIVKLAVEGENEYFYVLSDSDDTGIISVNVVDAMLSEKYETKNTQPDPGYRSGWIYDGEVKRCSFHVLAKGPDGEQQTAELIVREIAIYNNQPAVVSVTITAPEIVDNTITATKTSIPVQLSSTVNPEASITQDVVWETSNPEVALVDESGNVSFVGVGKAMIIARSLIDQSKESSVNVNVLSGYENTVDLVERLEELEYSGSGKDIDSYTDLYMTSWSADMIQEIEDPDPLAMDLRFANEGLIIENFFDSGIAGHVNEAYMNESSSHAYLSLELSGIGEATIYRETEGALYKETGNIVQLEYASYDGSWIQTGTYTSRIIVVWPDGSVRKLAIWVLALDLVADYSAEELADTDLWTIPDRNKQGTDPVIHALSPASLTLVDDKISIKQDKYPESKYCFGGIVSPMFETTTLDEISIVLDVDALNRMNDYVRTMWDLRIIYYAANGSTVINSNPLKLQTGYDTGINIVTFKPTYTHFRIYLVVNGSDIGAQFSDATMVIKHFKLYQEND